MAMSRRCGGKPVTSRPPIHTLPALGGSSPAISRRSVVLPDPDGPSTTRSSPAGIVSSRGCSAATPPAKNRASCFNSIAAKMRTAFRR